MQIENIVLQINNVIIDAGQIALDYYYSTVTTHIKKDKSIVSEADIEIEQLLKKKLGNLIPNAVFVGEEEYESLNSEEKICNAKNAFESEYIWAIDPIDGTLNFVLHYGEWAISIGLLKKNEKGHEPYLGSIYIPCKDKLYYTDGNKSYVVYKASKEDSIKKEIEPIIYNEDDLSMRIFAIQNSRTVKYNLCNIKHVRSPGGLVEVLASTAAGEAMGTILHENLWDITAGLAICQTAGVNRYNLYNGEEIVEFDIDDFVFSDTKSWNLKQDFLVTNESGKQILIDEIVKSDK